MISYISNFVEHYGLSTLIVGLCITAISILIDKFFKDKIPALLRNALPFILGVIISTIYGLIIGKTLADFTQFVSSGWVSSTLAIVIKAFINKLKSGKLSQDVLVLTVYELLEGTLKKGVNRQKIADSICAVIKGDLSFENAVNEVNSLLDGRLVNQDYGRALAQLIVSSTKTLI